MFVNGENKQYSSKFFNYKLYLHKEAQSDSNRLQHEFLGLKPKRISYFNTDHQSYAAFAQLGDKVILVSIPFDWKATSEKLEVEVIDLEYPHKRISRLPFDLTRPLSRRHQIISLAQNADVVYFTTRSAFQVKDEEDNDGVLNTLDHLLLLRVSLTADGKPEVRQLHVAADNQGCEVFMPGVVDDQLTYYVFCQTDLRVISMRSYSVDAAFTAVTPLSQI